MRNLFLTLILVIVIVLSGLWAMLYTQVGTQFTLAAVKRFIPGEFDYHYQEGVLAGTLTLADIHYKNKVVTVSIKQLTSQWHARAMLANVLRITKLDVNGLDVRINKIQRKADDKSHYDFKPPFAFELTNIHFTDSRIYSVPTDTTTIIPSFELSANSKQEQFNTFFDAQINHQDVRVAHIKLNGGLSTKWQLDWQFNITNLNRLSNNLSGQLDSQGQLTGAPNDPRITGQINATRLKFGEISTQKMNVNINAYFSHLQTRKFNGEIKLDLKPFLLKLRDNGKFSDVVFHQSSLLMKVNNKQLQAEFNMGAFQPDTLKGNMTFKNFTIEKFLTLKQPFTGKVTFSLNNLQPLSGLSPDLEKIKGKLSAEMNLSGSLNNPQVDGKLNLSQASFYIIPLNLNIGAQAELAIKNNQFTLTSQLKSSDSTLTVSGKGQMSNDSLSGRIKILGNNVLVSNTTDYLVKLSPDLNVNFKADEIAITGLIKVPTAKIIFMREYSGISLPDDVIIIRERRVVKKSTPLQLKANVHIVLGNDVNVQAEGLKGKLVGELNLNVNPDLGTTASGQLLLQDGTYSAYGRVLKIVKGNLSYTGGPLDNPAIYVQANRVINPPATPTQFNPDTITVGVIAQGYLKNPQLSLYSNPSLKQSDILSYLLFGQSAAGISGNNANLLLQAASALGAGKSGGLTNITDKVQKTLGLTTLGVQTQSYFDPETQTTNQNTALMLGKKLNKHLYASYSIGLLDPINTFSLIYTFNKYWAIQTESNRYGNGADLLFTISR